MAQVILNMKSNGIPMKGKSPLSPKTFSKIHSLIQKLLRIDGDSIPDDWVRMLDYIEAPQILTHNYIPLYVMPIQMLYQDYDEHHRLMVFVEKGRKCVNCGKEGVHLINAIDFGGNQHVDLYTSDFTLMTIDHIQPKSKGGKNTLNNLQPMCQPCNSEKGNTWTLDTGGRPVKIDY